MGGAAHLQRTCQLLRRHRDDEESTTSGKRADAIARQLSLADDIQIFFERLAFAA
jgi:hypothetical protein